jgi:alkanesulfonate monooxygenase SsuD/methylene tetrahydromethanopterin reductase-like flavin-dependent oxidoreductase (luciferase family)
MTPATEVATLDMISGGRAVLGLGAGHQPHEWAAVGRVRPEPRERADRLFAVAEATRWLLDGEEVTVDLPELRMTAARLRAPRPVQERVPLRGTVIEAQVHKFEVTDDPDSALRELAARSGLGVDELLRTPYVLVGTVDEIAAAIRENERRWGITRYELYVEALNDLPAGRAALEAG